ncbi:unnamed protein product [Mucor hiemalis]
MTYSNSSLNIIDINELLFESNDNKINNTSNTKSNEFNFAQVWGEIDAAALALNEQSSCSNKVEQSSLSAFIGDITPAAAAVAAAGESPLMNTPYLDSCMNTPFTPASVFTPSMAQFQNSPYYSPYIDSFKVNDLAHNDDIQVAKYLKNDMMSTTTSSWHTPAISTTDLINTPAISSTDVSPDLLNSLDTFNGDPSQLLLDTTPTENIVTDESSDFLFPPLPSDQQQQPSYQLNTNVTQNDDLFNTEDFDAGNFLDDCFDDCFLPIQDEIPLPSHNNNNVDMTVLPKPVEINNNKRKNKDDVSHKKNKRVKVSPTDAERKFECDICHATFNRRYNLGTHIKTHDKNRSKDYSCHLCMKPFDRKHDLTRHIATVHNGERAYSCTECTSTFSRKDALVRHHVQKHQHEA